MVLWALAVVLFLMNLGFGIVIPILDELLEQFDPGARGSGDAVWGVALGATLGLFNFAKIGAQVIGGAISDRFGDRRIVTLSIVLYVVSLFMLIEARGYGGFYLARFLEGVATGMNYPAAVSIIMRQSTADRIGRNMGLQIFAGGAGFVLGPPACDWLVENSVFGLTRDLYRPLWLMLAITIVGGSAAVLAFWMIGERERAERATAPLIDETRAAAVEGLYAPIPAPSVKPEDDARGFFAQMLSEFRVLWRFTKSKALLFLTAPILADKMILTAMLLVVTLHAETLKAPKQAAHYLLGALGLTFALFQLVAGWLADRVEARRLIVAMILGLVGSLVIQSVAPSLAIFSVFFVLYTIFSSILMTANLKLAGELYHQKEGQGRLFGVVGGVTDLGTVLGPIIYVAIYTIPKLGPFLTFISMAATGGIVLFAFLLSAGREKDLPRL